jgi:hypothetical protein
MKEIIKRTYPNAKDGSDLTSFCMNELKNKHQFDPDKTILGTSVCSDEIVPPATKFTDQIGNSSAFHFGGLGGYPFAGATGFAAFAGHIPDNGFAIILYGPHIGISSSGTIGYVQRKGQSAETTCCGALMASIGKIKAGHGITADTEMDFQQWTLEKTLSAHSETIIKDSVPLVKATDEIYNSIDNRIKQLLSLSEQHFQNKTVALIGGIVINTDFGMDDWFDLREFSVHSF